MNLEEVTKKISEFSELESKAFDLPDIKLYMDELYRIWEMKKPLLFKKYNLQEIIFDSKEIDKEWSDLMTIDDFIDCCECGGFIDSDGSGYYASDKHESNIQTIPSMITSNMIVRRDGLTHVVWYNK